MNSRTVTIPSINCDHCVATITRETQNVPGVESVTGDSTTKQVTFEFAEPAVWDAILGVLVEIGMAPAG